jgi:ADP-dependent NAD(P)H-hydrate dehydratase / NAD(P)H-hydrate epimerase
MERPPIPSHPILSAEETRALEARLFGDDEQRVWAAMLAAGAAVGAAALRDYGEAGEFPPAARILVLAGKGHNAGDALIAAREILGRHPRAGADVLFAFGPQTLGPLAGRAWRELSETCCGRVREAAAGGLAAAYALCLEGIFGFQ